MEPKHPARTSIEISPKTIVTIVLFSLGFYALYLLKDFFIGLFISILVSTALNPLANQLERFKLPRSASILFIYLGILTLISLLISTLVPPLIVQTNTLLNTLPLETFSGRLESIEVSLDNLQMIGSQLGSVLPVFRIISATFSSLVTFFTFSVITFYLMVERKNLHKYLVNLFPKENSEKRAEDFVDKIEQQIGGWVRGELLLMFVVGIITYIGLTLLNVPYALPLAILAGVLEIVPNIGPTIAAVPAALIPLFTGQNPIMCLFVIALYILIQQLENNLIVPKVMQTAVGIHPLITILLIIVGLKLSGVAGAVLAVPIYLVGKVVYMELIKPNYASHFK